MVNYSYSEIKQKFQEFWEDWMPASLPPFQAPPSNSLSDANSKIYTKSDYRKILGFFSTDRVFNPFCNRINCWNINLEHLHDSPETKQEYAEKVVGLLKKWQSEVLSDNRLDQTELNQLVNIIDLWQEKKPFKDQEKAVREHWNQTVFNNWQPGSNQCLDIVDKLRKEIEDGKITDDTDSDDPDYEMCSACLMQFDLAKRWETNYRKKIERDCRQGRHSQSPSPSNLELKIHNKCWMKVNKNSYEDIQPCLCSNVKTSELLEPNSDNLVKSFFIIDKVESIKKEMPLAFRIEYLNRLSQVVSSNQENSVYDDLVAYFRPFAVGWEVTRKDLNISDEPHDDLVFIEEVRKQILSYFREHGIESIRLKNNKLVIKYNFKDEEEEVNLIEEPTSRQLLQISAYCQAKGVNLLTLRDLEKSNTNQGPGNDKLLLYGAIAVAVALIVGLIAYLAYRSDKNSHQR